MYESNAVEIDEFDADTKGKQKRHWGSWAKADKDLFFEAISEFGKDFDKICSYMDRKSKTRGKSVKDCEPRNKDQIRYFYYRTWKQISKAVSLQPCESKRLQHELYCLICYGELRKKCRGFGNKDLKRLDELVTTGSTTVRHKGRKIRIKPPICRFLKKLIDDDDKSTRELDSIPEIIDVELYPHSNKAWTMAQCLAYNPRIRLNALPVTLKVKSLIKLLEMRFGSKATSQEELVFHLLPPKEFVDSKNGGNKSSTQNTFNAKSHIVLQSQPLEKSNDKSDTSLLSSPSETDQSACTNPTISAISQSQTLQAVSSSIVAPTVSVLPETSSSALLTLPLQKGLADSCNLVGTAADVTTSIVTPLLGGNVIASYISKNATLSPSQGTTPSANNLIPTTVELEDGEMSKDPSSKKTPPFFPLKAENCNEKDLQTCFLALNRPAVIRLEYDFDVKVAKCAEYSDSCFDKLVMLAQRDLVKSVKVSTQVTKVTSSASRAAQTLKATDLIRPGQANRSYIIPVSDPLFAGPKPIVPSSILKTSLLCNLPSLTNVITTPNTTIVQRKVVPRPRPIQPASKTLVAKAVAVNIVPQPATLVPFAQVPPVSTQLVNSGLPSTSSAVSTPHIETSNARPVTSTIFSVPSTSSLSTKLTIWSSPTSEVPDLTNKVQVEVIQEGSRTKAPVKRLHPTSVTTTEKSSKLPCLDKTVTTKNPANINEFDLSTFLATTDDSRSENDSQTGGDSINLSTILSGLTKNLCKNGKSEANNKTPVTDNKDAQNSALVAVTAPIKGSTSTEQFSVVETFPAAVSKVTTVDVSSVLTTPVKCPTKTPSKSEAEVFRMQPVNFEHNWFGSDVSELSLSGILDVSNLKDATGKSSDSSQASEISISKLLGEIRKKNEVENLIGGQGTELSLGTILGTSESKADDKKESSTQNNELSIGKLLDVVRKDEKRKESVNPTETVKSFSTDSLLMKPDADNNELSIGKLLDVVRKDEKRKESVNPTETVKSFSTDSLLMKPDADPVAVFESLMQENSVDYINKFTALTARLKGDEQSTNGPSDVKGAGLPQGDTPVSTATSGNPKDPKLPLYQSEDSVGLLDGFSFVLPTSDSNSNDFS
eukprot:gene582-10270_t